MEIRDGCGDLSATCESGHQTLVAKISRTQRLNQIMLLVT
jgi:hypothetical protein